MGYGLMPNYFTLATEAFVYLLFLYSIIISAFRSYESYRLHLLGLYALFLLAALYSTIFNGMFNYRPLISLRLLMRFYLFYLALINLGLDEIKLRRINFLLFVFFVIQIPTAAIKLYFYGIGESAIGTYDTSGGGLSTIIPIVALGYLSGYYFFYDRKQAYWLLAIGFIFFGIVGGKAALLFLIPATFLGVYYIVYTRTKRVSLSKSMFIFALVVLFSIGIGGVIIKYNPRLNTERQVGGSIDFSHALEYSREYTTAVDPLSQQYGFGRLATTMITFEQVFGRDIGYAFFGYGPGSLSRSALDKAGRVDHRIYRIAGSYGITGMVQVLTEYGLFGLIVLSLVLFIFFRKCWKWFNQEKDPYWKAFATGTLVFSVLNAFIFFTYNTEPLNGDTITPTYFYAMSVMYIRFNKIKDSDVNTN